MRSLKIKSTLLCTNVSVLGTEIEWIMSYDVGNDIATFLWKLDELSQVKANDEESEWTLVFIDCDNIQTLIQENKITTKSVQNSINLLEQNIDTLITDNSKDNHDMFGYHLGGDLFALFINDDIII